ncbi:hypothetical protein RB595_006793 [Gaeumannomyces hyphopodioides]
MPPLLTVLPDSHPKYEEYKAKFKAGWQHPGRSGKLKAIYYVRKKDLQASHRGRRFASAWKMLGGGTEDLFHGTQRSCYIGEDGNNLDPCSSSDCHVCGILRSSFKLGKACTKPHTCRQHNDTLTPEGCLAQASTPLRRRPRPTSMLRTRTYGQGSTSSSSVVSSPAVLSTSRLPITAELVRTADTTVYALASAVYTYRMELLAKKRLTSCSRATQVKAVTKANGGSVEYPETIVYQEDYIVPVAILVYEREGWQPR